MAASTKRLPRRHLIGMGYAIAERLASKGAKVVGSDQKEAGAEAFSQLAANNPGADVKFVQCDVTSWDSIQNVFNVAVDTFGTVDLVFANAGVAIPSGFPLPSDRDTKKGPTFLETAVNLNGVISTMQAALCVPY